MTTAPITTAIVPYYGCARLIAPQVGEALRGCSWVGIPFAGGMPEVAHIQASTIVVNDLHRHVINLAVMIANPHWGPKLYRDLRRLPFHPEIFEMDQAVAKFFQPSDDDTEGQQFEKARAYFVSQWMGRSGKAGTEDEFKGQLPIRWNANGGDSNTRYRSAVKSLVAWRRILQRCNFSVLDAFEFLANVNDAVGIGVYCDAPFPGPGDKYRHTFSEAQHVHLAWVVGNFEFCRVVMRFYDHPLVRDLYPEKLWTWKHLTGGRKQSNAVAPEVLLTRN